MGIRAHSKKEKYDSIMQRKLDTRNEVLCQGFAPEFTTFMNYARGLRFEERPDYAYLKRMYKDLFFRESYQYDFIYDWTILNFVSVM